MSQEYLEQANLSKFIPLQTILCCPTSKTPLTLMPLQDLLSYLPESESKRIPLGTVGAFISESALLAYPIIGDIVDFLEQDTLKLSEIQSPTINSLGSQSLKVKQSVKKWYDEFGWKKNATGIYNDVVLFSQVGDTGYRLYEILSHLSLIDRFLGGEFLLDAASGAIASPEYMSYSWFYKYRVCVDISLTALQEASSKLKEKGFYCLSDICQLPFLNNVFDGIVSGYTIQHIPESEQSRAVTELYRVLKAEKHLCIITNFRPSRKRFVVLKFFRLINKIVRKLKNSYRTDINIDKSSSSPHIPYKLYGFLHDLKWWNKIAYDLHAQFSIEKLRFLSKVEFELFFGTSIHAAKLLHTIENLLPTFLANISDHIIVDLYKAKRE
jgi:SAM-dependent methyltransferase/uncharacterized protein YbaR (Trm112 family)